MIAQIKLYKIRSTCKNQEEPPVSLITTFRRFSLNLNCLRKNKETQTVENLNKFEVHFTFKKLKLLKFVKTF